MGPNQLVLPNGLVTRADVGRLVREAEAVDNALNQAAIRTEGTPTEVPKLSALLTETAALNKLNLLQQADRQRLLASLQSIQSSAPTLHMSFNNDPSPVFQQGLITWVRQNLHPQLLLRIGLQPSIGAGAMVRSTNRYFDFSLRQRFTQQRGLLIDKLREHAKQAPPQPPTPSATEPMPAAPAQPIAETAPPVPTAGDVAS